MGHIVFGAPGIEVFHLHDRLQRELRSRGHQSETLLLDPVAATFWRQQGLPATLLTEGPAEPMRAPLDEFAATECTRLGLHAPGRRRRATAARIHERLARLLPGLLRWFQHSRPDLVLLHGRRGADQGLVQFVAREVGTRVLWTGDGLLPHTMQFDERGLDAEASASRRVVFDYRTTPNDPALLQACSTWLLGRSAPSALTRREVRAPQLWRRLGDAVPALLQHGLAGLVEALSGWRRARAEAPTRAAWHGTLPPSPFVAVLLQEGNDERVRLDATAPPSPQALVAAATAAAARLDAALYTVVVLPERGIHHAELRAITALRGVYVVPAAAGPEAVVTSLATFTINHPLAVAALLTGTPVLHTGRALYGLRGVTWQVPTEQFAATLAQAVVDDQPTLRERFLSWLLGHGHLWCSATHPDHNGLCGLVAEIEALLGESSPRGLQLRYRAGPPWPLAAEGRGA